MKFDVDKVLHTYGWRAARAAVTFPLLGKVAANHVVAATKLRRLWWKRVWELKAADWHRARTDAAAVFVGNCPPFGVLTADRAKTCQQTAVCPFCRGRRARDLYEGLARASAAAPGRYTLVEFALTRTIKTSPGVPWDEAFLTGAAQTAVRMLRAERRVEVDWYKPAAWAVLYSLDLTGSCLLVKRTGLLLVRPALLPDGPPPRVNGKTAKVSVVQTFLKGDIARAVGRAVAYPKGMMDAPADQAVAVLNTFYQVRLLTTAHLGMGTT